MADVPNRGFISVALESDLLEIDAPVQSLVWRNRDTIAGFVLHPTGIRRRVKCRNRVWIAVNGAVRGTIDFDIEVDPRMRTSTAKPTVVDRSHQISDSIGQQVVRLLTTESSRAQAFKNAFVCYAHDDWHLVSYLAESLEAGGINVWIDALKMKRAPDWESQAQQYVDDADLAYVCWSARAARSDSIVKKELEWIRAKLQRKSGEFDAILFKMDRSPAPAWLEDADGKYSKRWQFFRAGMREQYGGL